MIFGRAFRQMGDESRLVFGSLHIASENLVKKTLYMSLKLIPFLLCCGLLIHGHSLLFSNEDDGQYSNLKGPEHGKTHFRTLEIVILSYDDFKEHPHVCPCCYGVKLFGCCFVHGRVGLSITDSGKPVLCNDSLVNEVFLDGLCPSFA